MFLSNLDWAMNEPGSQIVFRYDDQRALGR